jgi:hypothetical protein
MWVNVTLAMLLLSPIHAYATTTLDYDAYFAGAKVGGAEVTIERTADSYTIQGRAWSTGFLRMLTKWRSYFNASGNLDHGQPIAEEYGFIEKARNKIKEIFLRDGEVRYTKNGRERLAQVDPMHTDLLTALFMPNGCATQSAVHNGKDYFRLTLTAEQSDANGMRCEYRVINEDDELTYATIWLGKVDGLLVPTRMDLEGAMEGTLRLKS